MRYSYWHSSYCEGPGRNLLAKALNELGFKDVSTGWRVGLPDGEVLKGDDLCRLALLAVWLRQMRAEELEA